MDRGKAGEGRADVARRLKEERNRIDLTADELALSAGVSRTSQFAYENGSSALDADYLQRIEQLGIDSLYVLSGTRTLAGVERPQAERDLLNRYQVLPANLQQVVESVTLLAWVAHTERRDYELPVMAKPAAKKTRKPPPR